MCESRKKENVVRIAYVVLLFMVFLGGHQESEFLS